MHEVTFSGRSYSDMLRNCHSPYEVSSTHDLQDDNSNDVSCGVYSLSGYMLAMVSRRAWSLLRNEISASSIVTLFGGESIF